MASAFKVIIVTQARMQSTRLPGKVLKTVLGKTMLSYHVERLKRAKRVDEVVVATSRELVDDLVVQECEKLSTRVFRGSESDVLERYHLAAQDLKADVVVRVTSDCPFVDPELIDELVKAFLSSEYDYLSNNRLPTYPHGLDAEVFSVSALRKAFESDKNPESREHVTPFITSHPKEFKIGSFVNEQDPKGLLGLNQHRWTLDYAEDFELIRQILEAIYPANPRFTWKDVLSHVESHPELKNINAHRAKSIPSVGQVEREYEESSKEAENFKKLKWGSEESLVNRLKLVSKIIDWERVESWIDIGCGTGEIFRLAPQPKTLMNICGIDLTTSFIEPLQSEFDSSQYSFLIGDFLEWDFSHAYDLVTCSGVLQKCGYPLDQAVSCLAGLCQPGGSVVITTKNADWIEFTEGRLKPEAGHLWFGLSDLEKAFQRAGLVEIEMKGLETKSIEFVEPTQSHTVLVKARRP